MIFLLKHLFSLIVIFAIFISNKSLADPIPQDFIFQNQQHQWENADREREIEKLQKDINEEDRFEQDKDKQSNKKEECFDIKIIETNGVTYFRQSAIEAVTKPHQNKCLTVNHINKIAKQINNLYIENGYIGTHAFLPQQNIKTGLLKIEVKEGYIGNIELKEEPSLFKSKTLDEAKIFFAMPVEYLMIKLGKKPALSLQGMEDGIYVFNKLPTNRAKIDLEPGSSVGDTVLAIKNNPRPIGLFSLLFDKYSNSNIPLIKKNNIDVINNNINNNSPLNNIDNTGIVNNNDNLNNIDQANTNNKDNIDQNNRNSDNNENITKTNKLLGNLSNLLKNTVITSNFDNSGLSSVGEYRQNYNLSQDNLLGINDNLTVYYSGTLPTNDSRKSDIVNVNYSIPLGRWNFTASNIYSSYSSFINGLNRNLNITGQTNITSLKVERLMLRGRGYRVSLFSKMNVWQINNYLEQALLTVSSRNSTTFETGINGMYIFLGNKSLYFNTSWVAGTSLLNASMTPNNPSSPNNQFNKIKGNLTLSLPFKVNKELFGIISTVGFQYGFNTLYSQEQLAIGDRYTVRGFQNYYLISDSGVYIRNDLVYNLPNINFNTNGDNTFASSTLGKIAKTLFTGMQLFVGYDWGLVQNYSTLNTIPGQNQGQISGMAFGSRWRTQYTNFELTFAKGLTYPTQLMVDNFQVYFSLGLVF